MFEFDFRNIIVLISLSIHVVLLWILFKYGRKTSGGRAYVLAILAIAAWVFPMILYRAHLFGYVVEWARLLYITATFTAVTFFYFTLVFPDNKKIKWWVRVLLFAENMIIASLVLHPTLVIGGVTVMPNAEDIIHWGPLYFVYSSHISLFFLAGFIVLIKKMRKAKGVLRKQIKNIFLGYFIGSNLAMSTNLVMPWFGYFELNWIGQLFSTIIAAFTTYAILRNKLLNIKVIATETFIILLNLVFIIQLFNTNTLKQFLFFGGIFLLVLFVSYLLIKSVKEEVAQKEQVTRLANSLKKANVRLQELDRQKTEFLSIASHQLRTPLSVIKGYVELIGDGAFGKVTKKTKEILNDIDVNNERLVGLVDEFLDITRIEQGRVQYHFDLSNVGELVEEIVQNLEEKAHLKGLGIVYKKPKLAKNICMDADKMREVIGNFIDNAIKYSFKGKVYVDIKADKGGVSVNVKDSGMGFDPVDQPNFFQKFYRGHNVEGTNVNGTGLGIYVCRKFVEAHDGRVWAKSAGLGKGSEFGFWIPNHIDKKECNKKTKKPEKQQLVTQYGNKKLNK
ncbi:MAG: hypothetical protein HOG08_03580 [Candidatus Magasanikbacteria bacterium]|jgi:signal transduction histidine kinase|nr:hypothetical protein [Candidatus Magasanikbacteria bacterium]